MVRTVFLAGHARLPEGMAAKSVYDNLALTVEIEAKHSVVLRCACTLVTELGREFVSSLLVGYSLEDGLGPVIEEVRSVYQGAAQNALVAALKDLQRCYDSWRAQKATAETCRNPGRYSAVQS